MCYNRQSTDASSFMHAATVRKQTQYDVHASTEQAPLALSVRTACRFNAHFNVNSSIHTAVFMVSAGDGKSIEVSVKPLCIPSVFTACSRFFYCD